MSMEVKKHLNLVWMYFKFNLAASMEYRGSFLLQVFGMMVNNVSFAFFWWILFDKIGYLEGYGFREVMFIWALASSAFGLAHIIFGNVRNITNIIINGELDAYLLQPKDVYINVLCSRTIVSAWGDFAYGLILFLIVYGFNPVKLVMFIGFVTLGGLLIGSVMASAEILTFFMGNSSAISRIVTEFLISFTLYPESIFRAEMRWIFYSIIPAGFIVFMPLRIMNAFNWISLIILAVVDIAYIVAGYLLFQAGLKRYESGNLIVTKL